jgi:uncharacterized membrane protein
MSELVAIAYPDVSRAEQVLASLIRLQDASLIDLEDACYVTKDAHGRISLHQANPTTSASAKGGAALGGVVGLMIGALVLMPVAGAAIGASLGAGTGAIAGHWSDFGIDDAFIKELGASLQPNTSAIIVLVRRSTPDKVVPEVGRYGGKVIRTSLSSETETKLQDALNQGNAAHVVGEAIRASNVDA